MTAFWTVSALWLVACVGMLWWVLPRIALADKELDHEEALMMDEEWEADRSRGWKYAHIAGYTVGLPPVRPVEDSDWQARARKAEALGFMDSFEDEPRGAA